MKLGFICPTYDAIRLSSYTEAALASFFATTPNAHAIVVDDGSQCWSKSYENRLRQLTELYSASEISFISFKKNGGVTRSWNHGLKKAKAKDLDFVVVGNNDIIFTKGWYVGLIHALNSGFSMVGPLSNAPGITAKGKQEIKRYLPKYKLTDDFGYLNSCSDKLLADNLGKVIKSPINGFFQFASMLSWERGKYDKEHYYCPYNAYTSKGRKNLTPLMTLNEDELQRRWRAKKMESAIVLSSFIFHYRAVTRGNRYLKGMWHRQ